MDREQRLAAAKKKLNIYKQQQQQTSQQAQPRRPSNTGSEPSPSSSSASSQVGQISPGIQAPIFNGLNGGHSNGHPANGNPIAFVDREEIPQAQGAQAYFPVEQNPPLPPLLMPLDMPPQQLDLLDSNSLQPHPTAHFDLLDSNTLPLHSLAQSSPGPSSSGASAIPGRDIAETHQRQSSSGSNAGNLINHDIVADINPSFHYNNDLIAFANAGPSTLPDVASDAPAPAAVTPGLIEDSQINAPSQREMEQDLVNRVNQQGPSSPPISHPASPPDNDLVATAMVSASNQNQGQPQHDHSDQQVQQQQVHTQVAEPSQSSTSTGPAVRSSNVGRSQYPVNQYPTPTFRRGHQSGGSASSSVSGMDDHSIAIGAAASAITTEVYELQLSQLRADNLHLQQREAEHIAQLQQVELTIQALRRERDDLRQELRAEDTPSLKSKLSKLYDENAQLKEKVRALELKVEEGNENVKIKVDSYNELEQALIVINKGKMELAAKLDVESEICKDLKERFEESQHQLGKLRERNIELESILSSHQLQLERLSSLEAEMVLMRKGYSQASGGNLPEYHQHEHDHEHEDEHQHNHHDHQHSDHNDGHSPDSEHNHSHHDHDHQHNAQCTHEHEHGNDHGHSGPHDHDHSHSHDVHDHHHNHDHDHEGHDHGHEHDHAHGQDADHHAHASHKYEDPKSLSAMEKKLARLEWENSSFREEIDRLAELLRAKTVDSNLLTNYQEDNERLKRSLNQAEHLVVQLSSENETIGDYIALYQTQRLALKERAREKENELATLSIEREKLRAQMEQLNQLLQSYHCKLEEGTAGGEIESNAKQINELVLGINSTFHPCSSCSGSRLMNV